MHDRLFQWSGPRYVIQTGENISLYDSKDNIINMPTNKTVVIQGLEGYIVVENDDTLLVCQKNKEQEIKKFVSDLKNKSVKE